MKEKIKEEDKEEFKEEAEEEVASEEVAVNDQDHVTEKMEIMEVNI